LIKVLRKRMELSSSPYEYSFLIEYIDKLFGDHRDNNIKYARFLASCNTKKDRDKAFDLYKKILMTEDSLLIYALNLISWDP
jgi:hypothetical protein